MTGPAASGPGARGVSPEVRVVEDPVADVAAILVAAVEAGGQIALSGGSSPQRAYELVAQRTDVDWTRATLWYGDDRAVALDHPDSNHAMVLIALLDRLPEDNRPTVHRIEGERGFAEAAGHYDALLRETLGPEPVLDLVLMGLGPDAHTASLFPGRPEIETTDRLVVGVPEAGMEPWVPRVTMTLPVFERAREVVFLVAGEEKAPAVARAFGDPPDPEAPASRVRPTAGSLLVVLDAAAAGSL